MQEQPAYPDLQYSWQPVVLDALVEYDPERMSAKLAAAEKIITARLLERPKDVHELLALRDAWANLKTLLRNRNPK